MCLYTYAYAIALNQIYDCYRYSGVSKFKKNDLAGILDFIENEAAIGPEHMVHRWVESGRFFEYFDQTTKWYEDVEAKFQNYYTSRTMYPSEEKLDSKVSVAIKDGGIAGLVWERFGVWCMIIAKQFLLEAFKEGM